jgi:hypothetical protein
MIVYGGKNENGDLLNDVVILNLTSLSWVRPNIHGVDPGRRFSTFNLEFFMQFVSITIKKCLCLGVSSTGVLKSKKLFINSLLDDFFHIYLYKNTITIMFL